MNLTQKCKCTNLREIGESVENFDTKSFCKRSSFLNQQCTEVILMNASTVKWFLFKNLTRHRDHQNKEAFKSEFFQSNPYEIVTNFVE